MSSRARRNGGGQRRGVLQNEVVSVKTNGAERLKPVHTQLEVARTHQAANKIVGCSSSGALCPSHRFRHTLSS